MKYIVYILAFLVFSSCANEETTKTEAKEQQSKKVSFELPEFLKYKTTISGKKGKGNTTYYMNRDSIYSDLDGEFFFINYPDSINKYVETYNIILETSLKDKLEAIKKEYVEAYRLNPNDEFISSDYGYISFSLEKEYIYHFMKNIGDSTFYLKYHCFSKMIDINLDEEQRISKEIQKTIQ